MIVGCFILVEDGVLCELFSFKLIVDGWFVLVGFFIFKIVVDCFVILFEDKLFILNLMLFDGFVLVEV